MDYDDYLKGINVIFSTGFFGESAGIYLVTCSNSEENSMFRNQEEYIYIFCFIYSII